MQISPRVNQADPVETQPKPSRYPVLSADTLKMSESHYLCQYKAKALKLTFC